jgi:uncharacterized protein YecE (DUF72 family)
MATVHIGCCGFGGSLDSYVELFDTVEIQHTFYQPPMLRTLERWRAGVPEDFEFAIKAWQLITHEAKSPTYRRLKKELSEKERTECGAFRKSRIVMDAWKTTLECAEVLRAKRILFQCPASLKPTKQTLSNMRKFFDDIDRNGFELYWEPRGKDWTPELIKGTCKEFGLYHAIDPFVGDCQTPMRTYFRLHGKGGWRYVYNDDEIAEIATKLPSRGTAYVLFNNIKMREDAERFARLLT